MQVVVVVGLIFAIIIAVFAVQNTQAIPVNFLMFTTEPIPVSVVVLVSAAVGAFALFVLGMWRTVRSSLTIRSDRKRIAEQDRALQELQQAHARAQESVKQLQRENEALKARTAAGPAPTSPAPGPATQSMPQRPTSSQPTT